MDHARRAFLLPFHMLVHVVQRALGIVTDTVDVSHPITKDVISAPRLMLERRELVVDQVWRSVRQAKISDSIRFGFAGHKFLLVTLPSACQVLNGARGRSGRIDN